MLLFCLGEWEDGLGTLHASVVVGSGGSTSPEEEACSAPWHCQGVVLAGVHQYQAPSAPGLGDVRCYPNVDPEQALIITFHRCL